MCSEIETDLRLSCHRRQELNIEYIDKMYTIEGNMRASSKFQQEKEKLIMTSKIMHFLSLFNVCSAKTNIGHMFFGLYFGNLCVNVKGK